MGLGGPIFVADPSVFGSMDGCFSAFSTLVPVGVVLISTLLLNNIPVEKASIDSVILNLSSIPMFFCENDGNRSQLWEIVFFVEDMT